MHEKKNLVKNLKTEIFLISIDQALIECQLSQVDSNQNFLIAISIGRATGSINRRSGKISFF